MKRIYPLGILLALAACKKDDPAVGLLPATQEGKNIGGGLINGERFVVTGWGSSLLSAPIPPMSGGFSFDSVYRVELNGQYKGQNATVMLFLRNDRLATYQLTAVSKSVYVQCRDEYLRLVVGGIDNEHTK